MRGAISLAAALSIPLDVAGREQIIVLTFFVIAVTLVGQGLTLGAADPGARRSRGAAVVARGGAGAPGGGAVGARPPRRARGRARAASCPRPSSGCASSTARASACARPCCRARRARATRVREGRFRYGELRRELIGVERGALLGLRSEGRLRPDTLRLIERDLDLEEARLSRDALRRARRRRRDAVRATPPRATRRSRCSPTALRALAPDEVAAGTAFLAGDAAAAPDRRRLGVAARRCPRPRPSRRSSVADVAATFARIGALGGAGSVAARRDELGPAVRARDRARAARCCAAC